MFWMPNTVYQHLQETSHAVSNFLNLSYLQIRTSQHLFIRSNSRTNIPDTFLRTLCY